MSSLRRLGGGVGSLCLLGGEAGCLCLLGGEAGSLCLLGGGVGSLALGPSLWRTDLSLGGDLGPRGERLGGDLGSLGGLLGLLAISWFLCAGGSALSPAGGPLVGTHGSNEGGSRQPMALLKEGKLGWSTVYSG